MSSPVIGIDYTPAYEQGAGIGRLTRDLIAALASQDHQTDYRLFVAGARGKDLPPPPGHNFAWRPVVLSPRWLARIWHRARISAPIEWFTGSLDLFHATDFTLPPVDSSTRTLLTVHDLSFVRVPDSASPRLKSFLDVVVPRSISRATHVVADSAATKRDLLELYGLSSDKVTVLLSGVGGRYYPVVDEGELMTIRNKYSLGNSPYIFTIGTVQPRKNYSRLIRALKQIRDDGLDIHLVIAGGKGWLEDEMYRTLSETGLHDVVHRIGYAKDEHLPALYSGAECVAFPSLYEGFGFPVLEGMACGTPVITSNVSSLPEVAGDAAIMIDPYDVDALAHALRRVLEDSELREQMIAAGFKQAARFNWEDSARQLRAIYRNVLAM